MSAEIVCVSESEQAIQTWLERCEPLHRVLRPQIPQPYGDYIRKMLAEGCGMAVLHVDGVPKALAVYRCHHTTFHGRRFYVDDLVSDEAVRGAGHGVAILAWCEKRARDLNADWFDLESGVQRDKAHRFYFRFGLSIFTFGFTKSLR